MILRGCNLYLVNRTVWHDSFVLFMIEGLIFRPLKKIPIVEGRLSAAKPREEWRYYEQHLINTVKNRSMDT